MQKARMAAKEKKEIEIAGGAKVLAQTPIIVSASRWSDIMEVLWYECK